ncbi:MAG TPA: HEAT repeat domain-containing protein, partial [Chromatiales bacterium]|nr:HEAT repeat domain-containing protein [Chromatiales bacterium]
MLAAMSAPEAELYVAPGCPYCPRVRAALERLRADGAIGALRVVDISREPERARALGIRAVPWLRLGPLELQGLHTEGELREWARAAAGDTRALARYAEQELAAGRLEAMTRRAADEPARWVPALLSLLADEETDLKARFGVSA